LYQDEEETDHIVSATTTTAVTPTTTSHQTSTTKMQNSVIDISYQHLHPYEVLEKLGITAYDLPDFNENDDDDDNNHGNDDAVADAMMTSSEVTDTIHRSDQPHMSTLQTTTGIYHHRSRKELFQDIHIALDYTLRTLVFSANKTQDHIVHLPQSHRRSDLTITEQDVLKSFLLLLQKTLPSSTDNIGVRRMVKAVVDNFMYAVKNHNYMDAIVQEYRPVTLQYSSNACPNSNITTTFAIVDDGNDGTDDNMEAAKKYTCVMWDILLMMSVGVVDFNIESYDATEMIHPASALQTILEYVRIFGLSTVNNRDGKHLQQQLTDIYRDCTFRNRCQSLPDAPKVIYEDNKDQVSKEYIAQIRSTYIEWKMVPVYIAAVRNITLPQHHSSFVEVWPPRNLCAVCWKYTTTSNDIPATSMMQYDDSNLYKYLKVEYGHIDAIAATYRHELLHESAVREIADKQQPPMKALFDETSVNDERSDNSLLDLDATLEIPDMVHTKSYISPQSRSHTILTTRQGSICILFLIISLLRWVYMRYITRLSNETKGVQPPTKLLTGNGIDHSQRTIVHNFDDDVSDHCCSQSSPARRMSLSPRKRQLLNRRFMIEQEKERSRQEIARNSSYRLEQLEASKEANDVDISTTSIRRLLIPNSPTPPLFQCEGTNNQYSTGNTCSDGNQHLRQRKSPVVPMTKPKVSLNM
jgi:hypothetical protein